jgi:hypothetical protein
MCNDCMDLLNYLLRDFVKKYDDEETAWDIHSMHYYIYYNHFKKEFAINGVKAGENIGAVYFSSKKKAREAINMVVKPFMKDYPWAFDDPQKEYNQLNKGNLSLDAVMSAYEEHLEESKWW